ncbi:MAG: lipoyl synthase [Thermodesulfobacteriota bacterium]
MEKTRPIQPKPAWLKKRLPEGQAFESVRRLVRGSGLHTVCEEAACPNIWECYNRNTAAFMILGENCSRDCRFCAVGHGPLPPPDPGEPERIAAAVKSLGLDYVVVTSVTRDDLPDCGAGHFAAVVEALRGLTPRRTIELLIPDLLGDASALGVILDAGPDVLNHNVETVPRLYKRVRPQASYSRSIELLRRSRTLRPDLITKSGLMLGLGETPEEVEATLRDLLTADCRLLTLGQYLRPSMRQLPVERYVPPEEFAEWRERALSMGFAQAACGPYVRSSYQAKTIYEQSAARPGRQQ